MDSKRRCLIELNISLLIMSITTLFPKLINMPVHYIIFGRSIIAAGALYIYIKAYRKKCFLPSRNSYLILFITGLLLAIHWLALFKSIQVSSVSIGILSFFSYPVITIFLEPIFYRNKLKYSDIVLSIFVIIGVSLILPNFELSNTATQGVIWGTISAFFFALRNIISKNILKIHSGEEIMLFQLTISAICLLPTVFIFTIETAISYSDIVKIATLGVFFTAIPHTLLIRSLAGLRPKTVSIISSLQPFLCVIIAIIFLNEIPSFKIIIGGLFILSAVLFEIIKCRKQ